MLRIHLLEAQNLVAKDKVMGMGKGKSDPYVKIYIGDMTFKSHVIKENLNPTWNEMYEVICQVDMIRVSTNLQIRMEEWLLKHLNHRLCLYLSKGCL